MRRTSTRLLTALALTGVAALGLTACTAGGSASSSAAPDGASSSALPPVIVELAEIDGTTVEVPLGNVLVLATAQDAAVTGWSAEIADDTVAAFVAGYEEGGASFNPGIEPRAEGTTEVVLRDSATSETLAFTLTVVPAAR
jgi:hypothetical protein